MKKQELIKTIKYLAREASQNYPHEEMVELPDVLNAINQLDEPELPVIPKFVAEWIEKYREYDTNVWHMMDNVRVHDGELWTWLWDENNADVLARAWLDGYTVEEVEEVEE